MKEWRWPSAGSTQGVGAEEAAAAGGAEGAEALEGKEQRPDLKEVGGMPMKLKRGEQTGTRLLELHPDASTPQGSIDTLTVALTTTWRQNALVWPMSNRPSCT